MFYKTKASSISGTDFREVHKKAMAIYREITCHTKRRPYIRAAYFNESNFFLGLFWQHIWDQHKWQDRMRRLKYFDVAIELIRHSRFEPDSKKNPNAKHEILHRFGGITVNQEVFFVQIKENEITGQKHFISVFPK